VRGLTATAAAPERAQRAQGAEPCALGRKTRARREPNLARWGTKPARAGSRTSRVGAPNPRAQGAEPRASGHQTRALRGAKPWHVKAWNPAHRGAKPCASGPPNVPRAEPLRTALGTREPHDFCQPSRGLPWETL